MAGGVQSVAIWTLTLRKATGYFICRVHTWWRMIPTIGFVMDKKADLYRIVFFKQQTIKLLQSGRRRTGRGTTTYYTLCTTGGYKLRLVANLKNIMKYAHHESQDLLVSRYNRFCADYLAHDEEIVSFIHGLEDESAHGKRLIKPS